VVDEHGPSEMEVLCPLFGTQDSSACGHVHYIIISGKFSAGIGDKFAEAKVERSAFLELHWRRGVEKVIRIDAATCDAA